MADTKAGPNPDGVTTLADLARELDQLRCRAAVGTGKARVTLEELATRVGLPRSTVHAHVSGRSLAPVEVLDAIVIALGASPAEQARWGEAWFRVAAGLHDQRRSARQSTPSPPRQLPPGIVRFTGRDTHIRTMTGLLGNAAAVTVLTISGMGGVGKTALAVHVGHLVAERFPDGQLYLDLRGVTSGAALARLTRALGVDAGTEVGEAAAGFRSALAGRHVLLVLDNAEDADQVLPLLPGAPGCAVIITSRRTLGTLPQAHHIRLETLTETEAHHLLAGLVGRARFDAEPAAAAAVARHCGRLPLALRLVGARLAARPGWAFEHLARRLADEHRRLDEIDRQDAGVRTSFAVSVDQLDERLAAAYALLGLTCPRISVPVAGALLGVGEQEAETILEHLTDLFLLEAGAPGWYRMHDLLHKYARERADSAITDRRRTDALDRVADLFVAAAWRSLALITSGSARQSWSAGRWESDSPGFAGSAEAFAWLDDHREHLVWIATTPDVADERVVRLSLGLFGFYITRRYWSDWSQVSRAALTAATDSDRLAQALVRMDLGLALVDLEYTRSGPYEEAFAHLTESLAELRALDDRRAIAACLTNMSEAYELSGDHHRAIACGEEGLEINLSLGDNPDGEAAAREYLGSLYGRIGDTAGELAHYRTSLRLNESLGRDLGSASVLRRIGVAQRRAGHAEDALAALQRSVTLFQKAGDPVGAAASLDELGQLHLEAGNHPAALEALSQALNLTETYGDRRRQADILDRLGSVLVNRDRDPDAR